MYLRQQKDVLQMNKLMSGAEAVLQALLDEEVAHVFGYPGGAIIPIYDALYDYRDRLQHVLVRHEQGAIHAAQGYARASGKTGVVFATSGPGATNLVTGLADAMMDSTPVVCITGQVYSYLLGTDAFQETDVISVTAPVTKWNCQVTKADDVPAVLAKAFHIATDGRPGPVLVDITKDAQLQQFNYNSYKKENKRTAVSTGSVKDEDYKQLKEAARVIQQAKRPFVVYGQGVLLGNAVSEFRAFIEHAGLPAASTILGLSVLPSDHLLYMGMLGMHGNYAPNKLTNECDVLIAVGMRFDDRVTGRLDAYARQAKIIHIDIDASEINKTVKADIGICGDCKIVLGELKGMMDGSRHDGWVNKFRRLIRTEWDEVIYEECHPYEGAITMGEVIAKLNVCTGGKAIVVTDVGQHQMVASRYARFNTSRSYITSGGLGTMGFALPAAIGAKMAQPEREVVAVIGDGGFQMNIQELGTIMQYQPAVKLLILNNQYLGMVRQWQELFHERRYSFVDITSPDFVAVAAGYGIAGNSVSARPALQNALQTMLQHQGPYLLEVMVSKEQNVFPMIPQGSSVSDIRLK